MYGKRTEKERGRKLKDVWMYREKEIRGEDHYELLEHILSSKSLTAQLN